MTDSLHSAEQDNSSDPGPQRAGLALSEAEANLIRSMLLRAAYGGLQGDIAMLRRFSLLWIARHAPEGLYTCHANASNASPYWILDCDRYL